MKRRYLYMLLFGIPGLLLSFLMTLVSFGMMMGILWLFVFGDNSWPAAVDTLLPILLIVVLLALWTASLWGGYQVGKHREADPRLNLSHVLASAALTLVLLAFVLVAALRGR